jgi:hypothetical protein
MDATAAQLQTIQVPRAKIHEARRPGGGLELVAQAPANFAGRIHVGGHEILQLAVNPQAYALRMVESRAAGLAPGFYTGPPSRCAVETLVGVSLSPEQLTSLLLGGGPVLEGPLEVLSQRWSRSRARELLRLRSSTHEQELEFAWRDGHWWFAGASLWTRKGDDLRWLWTIRHEELHSVGGFVLPKRTIVEQPDGEASKRKRRRKKDVLALVIDYKEQIPNPPIAGGGAQGDTWDENDWDDDEGWENDGESSGGDTAEAGAKPGDEPTTNPADPDPKPAADIAPAFRLNASGLTPRGDLCRTP